MKETTIDSTAHNGRDQLDTLLGQYRERSLSCKWKATAIKRDDGSASLTLECDARPMEEVQLFGPSLHQEKK